MLEERGVVGAATQVADVDVVGEMRVDVLLVETVVDVALGVERLLCLPLVVDGGSFGAGHLFGDVANELFQGGNGGRGEIGPGDGDIRIEVGDGMFEMPGVAFGPFGRADQALLFGVPAAEDDSPLGAPAGLEQLADTVHRLEHAGGSA